MPKYIAMQSTSYLIIKNTGWLYAKMGITMFISLLTTRLILNSLGVADFGIFNVVGGAISMLGFLNAAMAAATQRFLSYSEGTGEKEKQRVIFCVSLVLHGILAVVVALVLLVVGSFLFNGILDIPPGREYASYTVYLSLIISTAFTVSSVPYDAVLNAHENMRYYAFVGVIESLLKLSVALICVYTTMDKLIVYGNLMACLPVVTLCIMRYYCHRHYAECTLSINKYWDKETCVEMGKFATWSLLTSASGMVTQYGFGIILNHFFGALLNAAHGIANQLSGMLMAFSNGMLKALNPAITKKEGLGDRKGMLEASLSGCKFSFFILGCFAIPAMIQMPLLLKTWLGRVPDWAICFAVLQLLRNVLEQLTITLHTSILAQGEIRSYSRVNSIVNVMPLLLTFIAFYYNFPPYCMYITWILFWAGVSGSIKLYYGKKLCGIELSIFLAKVIYPCSSVALVATAVGISIGIIKDNICYNIISLIASFFTFVVLGWVLGCNRSEKTFILGFVKMILAKIS